MYIVQCADGERVYSMLTQPRYGRDTQGTACWGSPIIVVPTVARHVARGCLLCDLLVSVAESECDGTAVWNVSESCLCRGLQIRWLGLK
jgi:hypothetical protein